MTNEHICVYSELDTYPESEIPMRILAQTNPTNLIVDRLEEILFASNEADLLLKLQTNEMFLTVVLEHPLPNGLLGEIKSKRPLLPIMVIVPYNQPALVEQYLARGAFGFAIPGMSVHGIKLLLRSVDSAESRSLAFDPLLLTGRKASVEKRSVRLTEREAATLRKMIASPRNWVSRIDLLVMYGYKIDSKTHTVETHIGRLRRKMEEIGLRDLIYCENRGYGLRQP